MQSVCRHELQIWNLDNGELLHLGEIKAGSGESRIFMPDNLSWLGGEAVVFALRDVMPGEFPVYSNRPESGSPYMHGERLRYDEIESRPFEGRVVSRAIGEYFELLQDGIVCQVEARVIGSTATKQEVPEPMGVLLPFRTRRKVEQLIPAEDAEAS
jgi:hypothetical protein